MPETLAGPARNLSALSDQQLLEAYKTSTNTSVPDSCDISLAFIRRYPNAPVFEVIINNNGGQGIERVRLMGTVELLAAQHIIHPLVVILMQTYVDNQQKEDLYFFVDRIMLGFEEYTISC